MNIQELIDEIVGEVSYRTGNGLVDFQNGEHLYILSEVLTEMGLGEVKDELIQTLMEADEEKKFKNPILNKVVKYKSEEGEEREGIVGNLLRLDPKQPGRVAAEKLVPADGTPERKAMEDELGGEGQPGRDIEGEREKGGDEGGEMEQPELGTALKSDTKGGAAYIDNLPDEDPAKPVNKKKKEDEETLTVGGVVHPLGGGYYADTPDGSPKYRIKTEEGISINDFRYINETDDSVEGKTVVKKIAKSGGKSAEMVVIGNDEVDTAEGEIKAIEFEKLSSTEKSKLVANRINRDDKTFKDSDNKEAHTISLIQNRNMELNDNVMLPQGTPASSFAETNGAFYIRDIFSNGGELTEDEEKSIMETMMKTPLAKRIPEKDRKKWAKIAIETAKTEARVLLQKKKYNAKNPQPDGFPCGATMDKQNRANVERLLTHKLEEAKTSNNLKAVKYYEKQLKFLNKLKETDTGIIYETNDGFVGFKHTSNKSSYDDPHNNTSPQLIINHLKKYMGDKIDPKMQTVFDDSLGKLANASSGVKGDVYNFNKSRETKTREQIAKENKSLANVLTNFAIRGGELKDYLRGKSDGVINKSWFKKYAKEKGLTEPFEDSDIMNAVFENTSGDNPDTSAQKLILKLSEFVEQITPKNISQMAKKFNLSTDDIQSALDAIGPNFSQTAKSRRDVMEEVHKDLVRGIQSADSKNPNDYPTNVNGDNGPHQKEYVGGFLKRMHFDEYIMGERDGVASQNIDGDNVEPEHYRSCLAELSGFKGDISTSEGKVELIEYLKKRVRISPNSSSISFQTNEGKRVELGVDKYRTKGASKAVMGSLGNDLKGCLKSKAKI
jgi:hypothetical protein